MRILYMANNWVGLHIARWLAEQNENIVGLVLHPAQRERYGAQILKASGVPAESVIYADVMHEPAMLEKIHSLSADLAISVYFGYILRPSFLKLFPRRCINLHSAYLPYNRAAFPNIWSIIDETPAGATIHFVDEGVDTGDILFRRQVPVDPWDTGRSLHRRLEQASIDLFIDSWPKIKCGEINPVQQSLDEGSTHRIRDVIGIDHIDLDKAYVARDLINIIRARTFAPHPGAYIEVDGRRIYLRLDLLDEDEVPGDGI